tara:strand:- start:2464 stop:3396 length:933 start_codon:yes stop_codon:yes gene_type:complete
MIYSEPSNQKKLFGLDKYILDLIRLYDTNKYPNKLLLSGSKGIGKSTLAYHFVNYILSKNELYTYNLNEFTINPENTTFKTIINKSNPNLILIDVNSDKKTIDINQIRNLIINLNKSSFNDKPRFVLIDNIELLSLNSVNAILKILEEPNENIHFILINNNRKILSTLKSRCIDFKINLSHEKSLNVTSLILGVDIRNLLNNDLINYYSTPGDIINLIKFANEYEYDLSNIDLKNLIKIIIQENHYKKNTKIKDILFNYIEIYFSKLDFSLSKKINDKYSYFVKRISDTKTFNLDEESLLIDFKEEVLNG